MAFIKGPGSWSGMDEEEQGSGVIGGGSGVGGQQAGGPVNSSWTNLQTYLKANENAGGKIAGAITKSTQDDVDAVGQSRVDFEQKAKQQVDGNTKKDDFSSQILSDPTKVNDDQFKSWKGLSNYWGKGDATGSDGYGEIKGKVDSTQNNINTANDYYGQNVLANKAFGKGPQQYSQGMGYLDTFVARADQTGKDAFQGFQDRNAGFSDQWKGTTQNVNDYIGGAGARGQSAYDGVMGNIGSKIGSIKTDAQGRADAYTDKTKAYEAMRPLAKANWSNDTKDRFISRNSAFGADDMYNDTDLAALNKLAGMDDDAATSAYARGADDAYNIDAEGYKNYTATPPQTPPTEPIRPAVKLEDILKPPHAGPTPEPVMGPLPPLGPKAPAPIPTSPIPKLPSSSLPMDGGLTKSGNPALETKVNTTAAKPWPAQKPADWPSFIPYPPPWPNTSY